MWGESELAQEPTTECATVVVVANDRGRGRAGIDAGIVTRAAAAAEHYVFCMFPRGYGSAGFESAVLRVVLRRGFLLL